MNKRRKSHYFIISCWWSSLCCVKFMFLIECPQNLRHLRVGWLLDFLYKKRKLTYEFFIGFHYWSSDESWSWSWSRREGKVDSSVCQILSKLLTEWLISHLLRHLEVKDLFSRREGYNWYTNYVLLIIDNSW